MKGNFMLTLVIVLVGTISSEARAGWLLGGHSKECGDSCGSSATAEDNGRHSDSRGGYWCSNGNDCEPECDCDRPCCEHCGRKRPKPKKKCCLFSCLSCAEPPRAEAAFSLPARVDQNVPTESAREQEEAKRKQESAQSDDDRVDAVERDLTRLTLVVEQLAKGQQQQQADLTRATLILERIAEKVGP